MARTETYQTLLDKAETPVQTHILLAQLAILRRADKARTSERGTSTIGTVAFLGMVGLGLVIWSKASMVIGAILTTALFGN